MQAATGLLALAAAAAFEVDTPGRSADSHAWSSAVLDSATVIQPKREHAVGQDQDSTLPQATDIMHEITAIAPRAGGNYTSATYQRAKEAPSWVCKVPMRDGIALYVPTKSQRVKILQVLEHFLEHNIPTQRDGPCHPLLGISAFSNAKTVRLGLAECLSPASASLQTKQQNLNKWFNDFGFRARGKRDGNGQTPMRVFDPCTWNRHGYRIQDLGKRKDLGHPRLEFYHLEKLETKESRAPTRASERVAIRVAIEESLR